MILILYSSCCFETNSPTYSVIQQRPFDNVHGFCGSGNQQAQWDQRSLSLLHDVCTSSGKTPKLGARVIRWDLLSGPWCLSWEDLMLGSTGAVEWSIYPCPLHGAGALHSSSMGSRGSISRDQSGSCTAFYDLTWEVTQCHLRCFLLVRSK